MRTEQGQKQFEEFVAAAYQVNYLRTKAEKNPFVTEQLLDVAREVVSKARFFGALDFVDGVSLLRVELQVIPKKFLN